MVDPRRNISALRGLTIAPPPSPPSPAPSPPPAMSPRPGERDHGEPAEGGEEPSATPRAEPRRRGRARREPAPTDAPGPSPRKKATTLYLGRATRERLEAARRQRGVSSVNLVLEAIRAEYRSVASELGGHDSGADDDDELGLPAARRPRRVVEDGKPVQFRFSEAEHGALERLTRQAGAGVTMSELASACIDRHWPDPGPVATLD